MNHSISPYLPVPPELALRGQLVQIKQAADKNHCSADTLRNNAKTRNLQAFQQFSGGPVLVLPADVEVFLKSRPDIASIFHRGGNTPAHQPSEVQGALESRPPWAAQVAACPPLKPPSPPSYVTPPVPPAVGVALHSPLPSAAWIRLETLSTATPSELAIMATFLTELSNHLNKLLVNSRAPSAADQS